jgi:micrococcal nuclease
MNKNIKFNWINILSWVIGVLLLLAGLGTLEKSIFGGVFMILASLVTIPTITKFIQKKWNFSISRTIKIIAVIVLLIISSIVNPSKPEIKQSNDLTEKTEIQEKINIESSSDKSEVKNIQEVKTTETSQAVTQNNSQYTYYSVSSVVDGDTIKINKDGLIVTLRLIGLDTPETVDPRKPVQCFGKEASNKAKELLTGKKVRIETDSTQGNLDKYGRTLAYIYREDDLFYNKYMIEQGYAHEYTYGTPYKYQTEFKNAQKLAQTNSLGLWSSNTCNGDTSNTVKPASTGKYYTSSASNASKYYPDTCPAWESLSKTNLRTFNSLAELLAVYPNRQLAEICKIN